MLTVVIDCEYTCHKMLYSYFESCSYVVSQSIHAGAAFINPPNFKLTCHITVRKKLKLAAEYKIKIRPENFRGRKR